MYYRSATAQVRHMCTHQVAALLQAIWLGQSTCIYSRNIPAKFHTDPIYNDRTVGFFWRQLPQQPQEQDE